MMSMHKKLGLAGLFAAAALLTVGCKPEEEEQGFPQPADTIVLNFTIDASGRPDFYADGDLEWKGAFTYDDTTRILTYASDWAGGNGPYAPLYDDGPWTTGGHEPRNAVAGDDKFGIAAFIAKPAEALTIGYGAQTCCGSSGGWIWPAGGDGSVTVNPTDTEVTAEGMTLSPEGTVDLRLTLAANALGSGFTEATPIAVKGTFNDWPSTGDAAYDDGTHGDTTPGDHIYTYTLSANDKKRLKLTSGTKAEWVWLINNVEYKTSGGSAEQTGVKAYTNKAGAGWTEQTIKMTGGQFDNTYIDVP